jgi:hypothetical protein
MKENLSYAAVHLNVPDDTVDLVRRGEVVATDTAYRGPETGERALMRAVLQDAILCLRGHAAGVPRERRSQASEQAYWWFMSRDTSWPFSFESICDVLGLEATSLRRRLLQLEPVNGDAARRAAPDVWHAGGMVSRLRAVRMRGNQRKRQLRLRQRRRTSAPAAATRRRPSAPEGGSHAAATS